MCKMNVAWCVMLMACCLVVTRCDYAKNYADKVKAGVDAGKAIIDVLDDENFHRIGEIASKIGPFLGAIGPAVALVSVFLPTPHMKYMKVKFAEMDAKFDRVFNHLRQIEDAIWESGLRNQYSTYEHTITYLSEKLQNMLAASTSRTKFLKKYFIDEYDKDYSGATYKLWKGMMSTSSILSYNIPLTAMKYSNNDRKRVQHIMKGMMNLILQGVKVELGYLKAINSTDTHNYEKNKWETRIKLLVNHIKDMDIKVKNKWHYQIKTDIPAKLADFQGYSNSYFGSRLYSFLTSKYDWRDWHVVAYDEVRGYDKHCLYANGGMIKFRSHGRNLVVSSVDKSKSPINKWHARALLTRPSTSNCYHMAFWGGSSCSRRGAEEIYDDLAWELRHGSSYAAVGVIRKSASIAHKGPYQRLTYVSKGDYTLHAFG